MDMVSAASCRATTRQTTQGKPPARRSGRRAVEPQPAAAPRSQSMVELILIAFHHACDTADVEIATKLLRTIEAVLRRESPPPGWNGRRAVECLVHAHERLWDLRPGKGQPPVPPLGGDTGAQR